MAADLDHKLRELIDELELRRLVMRYARSCDQRDCGSFGALFAPDAVLEGPGFRYAAPDEIRGIPGHLTRFRKTYHTVLNFTAEVSGDRAQGETYSMAHHLLPGGDGRFDDLVMYITYRDRFVRLNGEWRFRHRAIVMEFTESRVVENIDTMPRL